MDNIVEIELKPSLGLNKLNLFKLSIATFVRELEFLTLGAWNVDL